MAGPNTDASPRRFQVATKPRLHQLSGNDLREGSYSALVTIVPLAGQLQPLQPALRVGDERPGDIAAQG